MWVLGSVLQARKLHVKITNSYESANSHRTPHPARFCQRACGAVSIRRSYRSINRIGCSNTQRSGTSIRNNTTGSSHRYNQREADSRTEQTNSPRFACRSTACIVHHRSISSVASPLDFICSKSGHPLPRLPGRSRASHTVGLESLFAIQE